MVMVLSVPPEAPFEEALFEEPLFPAPPEEDPPPRPPLELTPPPQLASTTAASTSARAPIASVPLSVASFLWGSGVSMGDYTGHLGEWYPVFVEGAAATMSSRSSAVASSPVRSQPAMSPAPAKTGSAVAT